MVDNEKLQKFIALKSHLLDEFTWIETELERLKPRMKNLRVMTDELQKLSDEITLDGSAYNDLKKGD